MPITRLPLADLVSADCPAESSRRRMLTDVNVRIAKAKKVVVVSGAGISCSSGIPDFRSENGLYALVKHRYPDCFVSGKDLFSSGCFANPDTLQVFYTFIAELYLACSAAKPTRTHDFIHRLEKKGKLLRSYTQNVDGFERRIGLESGGRGRGYKKNGTRNVELHGDLGRVRCVLCFADYEATEEWVNTFREGEAPSCPACEERCVERMTRAARQTPIGTLRPSIVLYDEPHPLGDEISDLQTYDMRRGPDVLLIMGTSLKVHGLKRLVKDFAKVVHEKKTGIVVFVNATRPSKEWEGIIDYHIEGETDQWVERMEEEWKRVRPQDWELQGTLDASVVRGSIAKGKPKAKGKKKLPPPLEEPYQLPTPPASQQSPRSDSIPLSDPPSSPLTTCPPDSPRSVLSPPPTPVSPSKRSPSRSLSAKAHKKTRYDAAPPRTGVPASPGCGNLFTDMVNAPMRDSSSLPPCDSDEDDFPPSRPAARTRASSVSAPSRKSRLEVLMPTLKRTAGNKENAPPTLPRTFPTRRVMSRTRSVPAKFADYVAP